MRCQIEVLAFIERTVYGSGGESPAPSGGPNTGQRLSTRRVHAYCQQWQQRDGLPRNECGRNCFQSWTHFACPV